MKLAKNTIQHRWAGLAERTRADAGGAMVVGSNPAWSLDFFFSNPPWIYLNLPFFYLVCNLHFRRASLPVLKALHFIRSSLYAIACNVHSCGYSEANAVVLSTYAPRVLHYSASFTRQSIYKPGLTSRFFSAFQCITIKRLEGTRYKGFLYNNMWPSTRKPCKMRWKKFLS